MEVTFCPTGGAVGGVTLREKIVAMKTQMNFQGGKTPEGMVMEGVNLRRDTLSPEIWRRCGMPRKLSETDALPFARFSPFGDGREICLLCGGDNTLYYLYYKIITDGEESAEQPRLLAALPARPLLAVISTPGLIRLLLEHQPDQYITYDGELNLSFHGAMPQLPAIKVVASEYNTLYGTVPAVKLSGGSPGSSGSQLTAGDNRLLTNALTGCYDTLCHQARGMGYCVQPRMARYRLLDAAGNTVVTGPMVPLSVTDGFSATGSVVQISDDGLQNLGEGRMEMGVYRVAVVAPARLVAPWNRIISKLVVEVTDEIDPISVGEAAPHGILRDSASGRATVTSRLPGLTHGMVIDKSRLRLLGLEAIGWPMKVAAEFDIPFDGGVGDTGSIHAIPVTGSLPSSPAIAESSTAIGRTWSAALEAGELTVLCNPCRRQSGGWSPDCFIASRDSGDGTVWRMALSVKLSTPAGETWVKSETGGLGNAPSSLSPVLSFPSSEATSLTVTYLSPTGTVYEEEFPLSHIPGRELACYVAPGLERIQLSKTVTAYLPKGGELPSRLEAGVAEVYSTADLGRMLDRRNICEGAIHAVKMVPRSGSGWDFSRLKLLFLGESGTYVASIDSRGEFHSSTPVDHRPVRSFRSVCESTGRDGASLLLYAGDDLVSISGQKATTIIHSPLSRLHPPLQAQSTVAIGWEGRHREIWLSPSGSGKLLRLTGAGEIVGASLPGINLATDSPTFRFATYRGALLLASTAGVHDLSDETAVDLLDVTLRVRYRLTHRPEWLTVNTFASSLKGSVTLSGDRGTEIAEPLLSLAIDGAVNAPIRVRLAAPRRQWVETLYRFSASPDLAIHPAEINL